MAFTYDEKGEYLKAIDEYKYSIAKNPNYVVSHYNLGRDYLIMGWYDLAVKEFKETIKNPDEMSFAELRNYVARLRQEGFNVTRYVVELYSKTAIPFVNFIMCLIAIPFALRSSRSSGIVMGVGISIIIAFSYWIILSFGISLGKGSVLPPILAAWLANIIFSAAGAVMLISTRQ
jgi:lipopolysaccharide export system permease protein